MTNFGFVDLLFYSTVLILYIYAYINDTNLFNENKYLKVGFPFDDSYGRRIKFLTYINMTMQSIYFGVGAALSFGNVVCSKLTTCSNNKTSKKSQSNSSGLKDLFTFMHASIIFPIGAFVSVSFWAIYFVDRQLIYPIILDTIAPSWQNHILHTLPLASLLVENVLTRHTYPHFLKGASVCGTFITCYVLWTLFIAFESGKWVYPILESLSPLYRGLFILSQVIECCIIYKCGQWLNSFLWPSNVAKSEKAKKVN